MKVLFLDIDGVLNAHEFDPAVMCGQIHRDKVTRLNHVLRETGAQIVLSSAWRYLIHRGEMNLMGFEWLLRSHGVLADRLIGITRPDMMERGLYRGEAGTWPVCNERGQQITDWLAVNRLPGMGVSLVTRYVVVDDGGHHADGTWTDLGITAAGHPAVITDGKIGLTDEDATSLIELLNSN